MRYRGILPLRVAVNEGSFGWHKLTGKNPQSPLWMVPHWPLLFLICRRRKLFGGGSNCCLACLLWNNGRWNLETGDSLWLWRLTVSKRDVTLRLTTTPTAAACNSVWQFVAKQLIRQAYPSQPLPETPTIPLLFRSACLLMVSCTSTETLQGFAYSRSNMLISSNTIGNQLMKNTLRDFVDGFIFGMRTFDAECSLVSRMMSSIQKCSYFSG